MRSESECRRPGFEGGVPVRLMDGQEWYLPRPKVSWRYTRREGVLDPTPCTHLGAEFDEASASPVVYVIDQVKKWFRLAEMLLLRNYDLADDDLSQLLVYSDEDEAIRAMWEEIRAVVWGEAPKASAGGDASLPGS